MRPGLDEDAGIECLSIEVSHETDFTDSTRPDEPCRSRTLRVRTGPHFRKKDVMSMTKSGIVLALCVLSQTVQGAEVRRRSEWPSSCHNAASYRETYAVS